ncbi:MAG: hypothetical protein EB127_04520 [Alphaproteobacteria bacterium]|nr:hypothetical protein [Alphaproteobacteria bacterium]
MDPAVFTIVTDADDTALKSYDKSMGGVSTSSKKAANALKAFGKDALQAKDGAELATAGAEALSHAFKMGLAGTAVVAGAKLVSDTIKEMAGSIKEVASITREAVSELQRMGDPKNLAEATKGIELLSKSLDAQKAKLGEITSGNWFTQLAGNITGATKEIEAQIKTIENLKGVQIAYGMAVELNFQKSTAGLSAEEKAYYTIEERLQKNLELVSQIKDETLRAQAETDAKAIALSEKRLLELEAEKKSKKVLQEIAAERAKEELKLIETEIKARNDAQAIERNFEEERKKNHLEELKRSAERIDSLRQEIKALTEKAQAQAKSITQAGNEMAQTALAQGGSGRGPNARKTSTEIAGERAYQQGRLEGNRITTEAARAEARKRLESRGEPSDGYAVNRELVKMRREAGKAETSSPAEALASMTKELGATNEKLAENQEKLSDSTAAQEELTASTDKGTASFDGMDVSVNKMTSASDIVSTALGGAAGAGSLVASSLGGAASNADDVAGSFDTLDTAIVGENGIASAFNRTTDLVRDSLNPEIINNAKYLSDYGKNLTTLSTETSNLSKMFNELSEFECEYIATENIYTESIILN